MKPYPQRLHPKMTNRYGLRILVVDDSRFIRIIVIRALENAGFQVETAEYGSVAIKKALAHPPDLILLDITRPELDGWATIRRIRMYPELKDTPVVVLSENGLPADAQSARTLGVHSYLTKPFADDQLVTHIRAALHLTPEESSAKKSSEASCILVVDDNRMIRRMVKRYLEAKIGCALIEASDGKQACHLATLFRPDLILMDISMPVMDGLEAIRRIRNDRTLTSTVIIAMTANALPDDVTKALGAGINDYIVKPFSKKLLVERVMHYLSS